MDKRMMGIEERIIALRKVLGLSQEEFAKAIGISQSSLSQVETQRVKLSLESIYRIAKEFNVNPTYVLLGSKPVFLHHLTQASATPPSNKVYLIQADAHADYPDNFENDEYLDKATAYVIPGFENGNYRMFETSGDSMEPTVHNNDIVIVESVNNIKSVGDGDLYVLITKEGVLLKRIYNYEDGYSALILKSDNPKYKSVQIKRDEILEIWQVKAKITSSFLSAQEKNVGRLSELEERMENIEKILKQERDQK